MPIKLIVALVLLALTAVSHISNIASGDGGIASYVVLGLMVAMVAGLVRGSEAARALALALGGLCLLGGVLLLAKYGSVLSYLPLKLQAALFIPLVFGGYLLWCMTQEDVKAWLYKRAYGRLSDGE
jgi:hypothetical protein